MSVQTGRLAAIIAAEDPALRDTPLELACANLSAQQLLAECADLDGLRRRSDNLYHRVRALMFLAAIYRYHLPPRLPETPGHVPFAGYEKLLTRRFDEAIDAFLSVQASAGPSDAIASALAVAYHDLAFQTLANQVRRSVRSARGNQWMFRIGHPLDQPLRIRPELLRRSTPDAPLPILAEQTAVRMDLSHSAWSDIFFLGMDYPQGARVLNVSIDLAVRGRDRQPRPPVEAYLRVIDEPVLRLVSVDLGARADITSLPEVFDFAKDYLGLLKAAIIASGIIPPGIEGSGESLADLLARLIAPGCGLELVSSVNGIPKGSRLAVSTNLLGCLISVCMRATGQARSLTGGLTEDERRIAAARAILGEWLGGSGGGWQDSGGLWPAMKLICGVAAGPGDPEHGVSRGRLLPSHRILDESDANAATRQRLQDSLVLVHGGMAQNVGPILEMVTEKYLLRSSGEWKARGEAIGILDRILQGLRAGDVKAIGAATTANFRGPIQTIIPWASNLYTETLIERVGQQFGSDFWGFWMLGGMSGGGMGFIFDPSRRRAAQDALAQIMADTRRQMRHALPFAMDPVVYDFSINTRGTWASLIDGEGGLMPAGYYALVVPPLLRADPQSLPRSRRLELDRFGAACRTRPELGGMVETLFDRFFARVRRDEHSDDSLGDLLQRFGFDSEQHERVRGEMRAGRIGLAQNRLPASSTVQDVREGDVIDAVSGVSERHVALGRELIRDGSVAVVSLAAGAGSRWTQGAGVVKALHPFCRLGGAHRTFIEVHLAKTQRIASLHRGTIPHVVTTSYLTHDPIAAELKARQNYGFAGPLHLSPGHAVGLRLVPMARDLRFAWEESPQQLLDEQKQKMRQSLHAALIGWARSMGEGNDYTENVPMQCLHPVGHWYEIPNMLRSGLLEQLLIEHPSLKVLMLHNIDTLGADVDPGLLGLHVSSGAGLSFEVMARRLEDRGGGLARVNGRVRLVEGLAMPHERDEFALSYYNTATAWIDIDQLLGVLGLSRGGLSDRPRVAAAVRELAARMPTYLTLKDVKKRWGHGQEDVYPVAQWERLWGDMTALPEVTCSFIAVSRRRGQQLKDQAQLDGWLRDGSAQHVESVCGWH